MFKRILFFALVLSGALSACAGGESGLPDPCQPACGENGVCDAFSSPAMCRCFPGWQGPACDTCSTGYEDDGEGNCVIATEPPSCTTDSCSGHGLCDDSSGEVVCSCSPGYKGSRCDLCQDGYHFDNRGGCAKDFSCADSDPCGPHGTCFADGGTGRCDCEEAYAGEYCTDCASGFHLDEDLCIADEHCPAVDPCVPHGSCDDSSKEIMCICSEGYDGDLCEQCAAGYIDLGQGCEQGTSCEDYPFADNSYVYEMRVVSDVPCCFDFNGDGVADNAFADLVDSISSITGLDYNAELNQLIVTNAVCNIFDMQLLDSVDDDDSVNLTFMWGTDSDGEYENNLDGSESFTVDADSFIPGDPVCTMEPLSTFDSATISSGMLSADTELLHGLKIPFIFGGIMSVSLKPAKLTASLSLGPHGLLYTEGKLGGVMPMQDFCQVVNDFAEQSCECLGIDGPLVSCGVDGDRYKVDCTPTENSTCESNSACANLEQTCPLIGVMLGSALDVDTDDDAVNDAMSIGLEFSATSATVTGITQ